jgi:hypothetical protein
VERAPRWQAVGRRGMTWRASSGGGGDWLVARREVQSTGGAHGGVGGAVPSPEVPGDGGAPVDMAAASDTLPSATALSTCRSWPVLEEGVAPALFDRWTAAADKGDLRRRTRPVVTDGAQSPFAVSRRRATGASG